ncbi:MAG: hypothetical protein EOP22_16285, partial [Hyphomicrobiales bacterium]
PYSLRHPREGGDPGATTIVLTALDSRLRGNDVVGAAGRGVLDRPHHRLRRSPSPVAQGRIFPTAMPVALGDFPSCDAGALAILPRMRGRGTAGGGGGGGHWRKGHSSPTNFVPPPPIPSLPVLRPGGSADSSFGGLLAHQSATIVQCALPADGADLPCLK